MTHLRLTGVKSRATSVAKISHLGQLEIRQMPFWLIFPSLLRVLGERDIFDREGFRQAGSCQREQCACYLSSAGG